MSPSRWSSLLLLLGWLCLGTARGAEPGQEPGELGERHYQAGQYQEALTQFQAAYVKAPQPIYLYNIAQCLRHLEKRQQAIEAFQRFLREASDPSLRQRAEGHIARLREQIEAEHRAQEQARRQAEQKALALRPAVLTARPPAPPPDRRRWMGPLKWTLLGLGLAGMAAGAALVAIDGRHTCDIEPRETQCPEELNTLAGGAVLLVGGGLSLAGSAVLLGLDARSVREPAKGTVTLGPVPMRGGLMLGAAGEF